MEGLEAALEGRSDEYDEVLVPEVDRDAIARSLGTTASSGLKTASPSGIRDAVRRGALGLLRATDVTPGVRALAIGGRQLFGVERLRDLRRWPLLVPVAPDEPVWDARKTWTLVAAGDILLDRGVARQTRVLGKGPDFPFDGGTAEISGYECCSQFGHRTPLWKRTGNEGAVRRLLTRGDLAIANLESPVDDHFDYHTSGTVFSGDPRLLVGLKNAGLDFVSLGNNHIGDVGEDGIAETIDGLERLGIAHAGAGDDLGAARRPAILAARGVRVAIIACDAIASYYWADSNDSGSMPCDSELVVPGIRAARRTADLVIVFPHWGVEYEAEPTSDQRAQARRWIAAGADMIIGNHAHWTAAIEEIDARLVFYALGNFVFDQDWSEATMEGMVLELSFHGATLAQARLHPTLIVDESQPNFLDPSRDGRIVLERVREASEGLLPY